MDSGRKAPARYRVAWRWNESGQVETTAWTRYNFVVEGWEYSLSRRHGDQITLWIERDLEYSVPDSPAMANAVG